MNTPKKGKDKVLMFRLLKDKDNANASRLALQTTHTIKESHKIDTTQTKDGSLPSVGGLETTIDLEAMASDDLSNEILHYAQKKGLELEVWEIDFSKEPTGNKYPALYGSGYLSDWETPANVDENTTIKTTLTIGGELARGLATVNELDLATVKKFFRDTVKGAKEEEPLDEAPDYGSSSNSSTTTPSK
jgi:TP901-1 family phage major tail protein